MSKRRYSDVEEKYADKYMGPEQFLEAGTRGFLVTTQAEKEEFGVDDAIDLLRQAAIKLHGGIRAKKDLERGQLDKGYVRCDFMDPKEVVRIPNPDGDDDEEEEKEVKGEKDADIENTEVAGEEKTKEPATDKETKEDVIEDSKDKETKEDVMEDSKDKEIKEDVMEDSKDKETKENVMEDSNEQEANEEAPMETQEDEKEKDSGEKNKDIKKGEKKENKEEKSGRSRKEKSIKKDEKKKEKKTERSEKKFIYFKTTYKFKAFRTEIRNLMFVTSDYPDPIELGRTVMDIVMNRKSVTGDAVQQLVPVLGVSEFDLFQLEVMSRRVLSPVFDESLPPKFASVLLFDKLSEPGSLMLTEVVRNVIWSINPLTTLASPLTEPDIVIRLEVIGSKLVMCCMPDFIKYRQYSPYLLVRLGPGEAEDDDLTHLSHEMRQEILKERAEKRKEEEELKQRQDLKKQRREEDMKRKAAAEARKEAAKKTAEEQRKKREEERKKKAAEKTAEIAAGKTAVKTEHTEEDLSVCMTLLSGGKLDVDVVKEDTTEKMETDESSDVKDEEKEKVEEKPKSAEEDSVSEAKVDEVELKPEDEPAKATTEAAVTEAAATEVAATEAAVTEAVATEAETEEPPSKASRSRRSTSRKSKK